MSKLPALELRFATPPDWLRAVESDVDAFLQDHAANERKVCHSALTLAAQYPGRLQLVDASIEIAREELEHFMQVHALLKRRGRGLAQDAPDPYVGGMRRLERKGREGLQLMDRLLIFSVVEARGYERFAILAGGLSDASLRDFYAELARSEARHRATYLRLARNYFGAEAVAPRLSEMLDAEAELAAAQPLRAALH